MTVTTASIPRYEHIVVAVEENHSFSQIIGNAQAPYINSLATSGASLTNFHAITHPSEPNYLALYAGSTFGITDDNNYVLSGPTLATILQDNGNTFLGYAETASPQKHNPWQSFPEAASVGRDFSTLPADFSQLPNVAFVVPNLQDDMHDGTIAQADQWLQSNLNSYAQWAVGHNSLLVVTWDEANGADPTNHIPTILYGAAVNSGDYSDNYNLYNLLSTLLGAFDLNGPNNAASAAGIGNGVFYDVLVSDAAGDTLTGGATNNAPYGEGGDDRLTGNAGNDMVIGGSGTDTAVFSGDHGDYAVNYVLATQTDTVADQRASAPDGTDTVSQVEQLQFADGLFTPNTGNGLTQTLTDTAGIKPWTSQVSSFDALGSLASQTINNDNGTHSTNEYDTAGTASWTWRTNAYDGNGQQVSQTGTNDDGSHWLTLFDTANAYSWSNITINYDTNWNWTGLTGTRDDGSHTVSDADIAAAYDTLTWFSTPFDANWNSKPVDTVLTGGGNHDVFYGNAGNDTFNGAGGADILAGGTGNDTFVFRPGEANGDTVLDFDAHLETDLLQFTSYGPGATLTQTDATHVQVDYNGGASHDIITLANAATIHLSDYHFV